jgi:hypothetical protein
MGSEKQQRHSHHHQVRDRPASTDMADVSKVGEEESAAAQSKQQRHAATAGPSEDDRWGEGPVAENAPGRILLVQVKSERTQIMIGLGQKQGVHVGMEGYVKAGDGMLCDFQITEVHERTCFAFVDTTIDSIQSHTDVVVNPPSLPASAQPRKDMKGRIVGLAIEGDRVKLMIGLGMRHGARAGMKGYLVGTSSHPFDTFEVVEEHPGHTIAYLEHTTLDAVRQHTDVVLNPSNIPGEIKKPEPVEHHHHGHHHQGG